MDKEQVCVAERRQHPLEVEQLAAYYSRVLLLPDSPGRRGEVRETLDGNVGQTRQNRSQVVADRNLHPAAGFHDGENRGDLRPSLLAAYMDPVLPVMCACT